MPSLTCQQFIEFLDEYLTGEQTPAVRSQFEHHLSICPHCADYVKTYRDTMTLGKAVFTDSNAPVPRHVPDELVKAILSATSRL